SEGGGSGGHAALLIGDRVFHFEHRAPGLLRLAREPFEAVRRRYALEENRTIELLRIGVSDETRELILEEFTRRHLVQTQHLEDHQALVDDRRLLEAVLDSRSGAATRALSLEGAGFFVDEVAPSGTAFAPTDTAPALVRLRERVEQLHGPAFVTDSSARIRAEAGALELSLGRLAASPRADRGFALLLGMARLIALDETIRTGRWSVLDAWRAGDGPVIARDRLLGEPELARALRERARARFRSAAGRVGRTADEVHFPEAEFARLEAAANQLAEIERAFRN